jgi:exosortase
MIVHKTSNRNLLFAIVIAIIVCIIYFPALRWMVNSWMSSDYYSHGFLVPLISGFLIWTKREAFNQAEPSLAGAGVLIFATALYVLGFIMETSVLGAVAFVLTIVGLILSLFGFRTTRAFAFPLVFLLFMIPFEFIQNLAYNLQYISVQWASAITAFCGLPIVNSGANIYMGNVTFTVGIVCSGINTLVALLALSAVYAFILKGSIYKRFGIFILAFPIAIGANILRVASVILMAYFVDVKFATGLYHDMASPVFFFIAFGILILISWAVKCKMNYTIFGPGKS